MERASRRGAGKAEGQRPSRHACSTFSARRFLLFERLACLGLVSGVLLGGCGEAPASRPLPGVDVRHYDLALRLNPATGTLRARAVLDVRHPDTLATLALALKGMVVDALLVDGAAARPERRGGRLLVPLPPGRDATRLEVVYHGRPVTGLYERRYGSQQIFFTDSWPDEGRGWLPGVHHPADPATLALSLTLPRGLEAVAAGTLQALDTLGAEVRYRWQLDVPVPTYAFAFAVADFSVTETAVGDTLPVRYYMLTQDAARADRLARTPQALAYFSDLIGPYAFSQYASVELPIRYAGMENASASFLQASLFETGDVEEVQVHELAHQWFGDRVPIESWSDLWLSEGTATYLTTLFYEHADGLDAARRRWTDMAALSPARRRTHRALAPAASMAPRSLLTWVPYDKGAAVLHLLRRTLGDDAFFAALRDAYRRHAGHPLSSEAFRHVLEAASGRDLAAFFAFWVYGDALPGLTTAWDPGARTLSWSVEGDAGTLAGVPFALQLRQGNHLQYVSAGAGTVSLPGWGAARPEVRPVGVMMRVD